MYLLHISLWEYRWGVFQVSAWHSSAQCHQLCQQRWWLSSLKDILLTDICSVPVQAYNVCEYRHAHVALDMSLSWHVTHCFLIIESPTDQKSGSDCLMTSVDEAQSYNAEQLQTLWLLWNGIKPSCFCSFWDTWLNILEFGIWRVSPTESALDPSNPWMIQSVLVPMLNTCKYRQTVHNLCVSALRWASE